jgi:rhodanese-related sulfurtransferase
MRPEVTIFTTQPTRRAFLALAMGGAGAVFLSSALPAQAGHDNPGEPVEPTEKMAADAAYKAAQAGDIILVDIRRPEEWLETRVGEGAIALDMREESFVASLVALRQANPDKPIALICATGMRSAYVASALTGRGFPGLVDVSEGMIGGKNGPGWLKRGLPTYDGTITNVVARRNSMMP